MRAVVWFGLLVLAVALITEDASAISFDDLIAQAEESRHPTPKKKVVKRVDPEMQEWSTDHLLGLDQPPPQHMFDNLFEKPAAKKHVAKKHHKKHMAKKHHKKHRVMRKHKVSSHKKLKASKHHKVAKKVHTPSSHSSSFAASLLGSIPKAKHHHSTEELDKTADGTKLTSVLDRQHGKTIQMVTTHIEDPAYEAGFSKHKEHKKEHKKVHKKEHKKKVHKKHKQHKKHKKVEDGEAHDTLLGGLRLPHDDADAVVPEAEAKEELLAPSLPRATHHHKHAGTPSLSGLASTMLAESDRQDKAKRQKVKKANDKAAAEKKQLQERERQNLGGKKPVELDLSADDDVEYDDNQDDDVSDSLSDFLDDDDMLIQLKDDVDADEW